MMKSKTRFGNRNGQFAVFRKHPTSSQRRASATYALQSQSKNLTRCFSFIRHTKSVQARNQVEAVSLKRRQTVSHV